MVRHSKKNRRGGAAIDDIQIQLDSIQEQVNDLKKKPEEEKKEEIVVEEEEPIMVEKEEEPEIIEESVKKMVNRDFVTDKDKKFKDGAGGRVTLSFSRLNTLLDGVIKKGDTKKAWSEIKESINNADNEFSDVQDLINKYKISFASNYVAGTRRKKRHSKKRTSRR